MIRSVLAALCALAAGAQANPEPPPGMVWVPPGVFTMGSDRPEARPDESPAHPVRLHGFFIDVTEVTNAQFRRFTDATGYITTAERPVDWEEMKKQLPPGTPKPSDDVLVPGSLVFTPPPSGDHRAGFQSWWTWTPGANWRHPDGPGSSIDGKDNHPVVHVSWDDAAAYAAWAGKRLPTEAEWERAARFGHDGARFTWGNELTPDGQHMANIWQGTFPSTNTQEDGHPRIAPVRTFPPNELGLYDTAGNVWEWTADLFDPAAYAQRRAGLDSAAPSVNPKGPHRTADPRNPSAPVSRVHKGGSFLCHVSYCESYRPSAKMAAPPDTGLCHLGFRCVADLPAP